MGMLLTKLSGSLLLVVSFMGLGCTTAGGSAPIPVPVVSLGNYYYDTNAKSLSIQVYGSNKKLNPTSLYIYNITVTRRDSDEYVLSGTVTDGFSAEPFDANRGMARTSIHLTDVVPGIYKFIDDSTNEVVGTVDTSAPSPPFTDPA